MSLSTKDIKTWDSRLKDQNDRGWENYLRRRIHLDAARDLDRWAIAGEFIYIEEASSAAAVASIRLNRNTNDPIDLEVGTCIKTIFTQLFITHAALQDEWIDVIWGINFEYFKPAPIAVAFPPAISVDDGGGSLTVDGTFWQATQPVSAAALPLPAGAATSALQLPDGHNVTVDNVAGAAAVNFQDGGNSITIDGNVGVLGVAGVVHVDDNGGSLTVDGTFFQATQPVSAAALPLPAGAATAALQLPDGHNVTVDNAAGAAAVNIQDGGNSLTVDGTFWQATQPVSAAALPLPAGAATAALQTQPGVDVGDVTVNNAAGAAAVNVQDGGNSLTVDGAVTAVDNGTAQPCIIITNATPDLNTIGANHACKRVLIRAHTINTGLVWVDFNNAAVALACYPLAAGDAVSVPLANTNLVNCLFKVANEKVTVVYTN